ncbi:hypothetical protein PRIPAC_82145 [Pristionchus pacificus]|uniref:G protein-coupled receptor n=1 Tax=Pristionchus pacificus TaxID=54126 RepID=A0A2A6CJM5_PRIPA|nr:hypothetical protein PRIPAC_82145 [Pristionchus pacificus]|eukprot:PDM78329.1 G protein-coupled receptor [Pristionchus pacificus]
MAILITRVIHDSSCIISILLNTLLTIFIFTKTPEQMRNYSIILLVFSVIELATASTCLFVFNRIMSTDSYDLNAITGPCFLTGSSTLCFISYAIMMHGHSHYCIMLAFGFCYRYYVLRLSSPSIAIIVVFLTVAYAPTAYIYVSIVEFLR